VAATSSAGAPLIRLLIQLPSWCWSKGASGGIAHLAPSPLNLAISCLCITSPQTAAKETTLGALRHSSKWSVWRWFSLWLLDIEVGLNNIHASNKSSPTGPQTSYYLRRLVKSIRSTIIC
jgi:hypothetical protein